MAFCNSYTPSVLPTVDDVYGPDPYDLNFCFPYLPGSLENNRVKLSPFIPCVHGQELFDNVRAYPELYTYLPFPLPETLKEHLTRLETWIRRNPGSILFVISDKDSNGTLAGVIALLYSSVEHLSTEIGYVMVFPPFQRTHVSSNAIGLLLRYCLNLPSDTPPGLGLRRVEWRAHGDNKRSVAAAQRMGIRLEGTLRWARVLAGGQVGNPVRAGDPYGTVGRDSVVLAMCWDDWENGQKEHVEKRMSRLK